MTGALTIRIVVRRACCAFALLLLLIAGCQRETVARSDGRPIPRPRPAPRTPVGAQPNRMTLLSVQKAEDSDGNGFPDRIHATAALFAVPHEMAIEANGAFVLTLFEQGAVHDPDAQPIGQWRFEHEQLAEARRNTLYGVAYQLQCSLLDLGTDRLPPMMGDLRGRYEPADGGPVVETSDEIRPVQIGRRP